MKRELSGEWTGTTSPVRWLGIVLVSAVVLMGAPALSASEEAEEHEAAIEQHEASGEEHEEGGEEHGEEHHLHKHHFAVIIVATESLEDHGEEHNGNGHGDPHAEPHSEGSSGGKDDPNFTIGFDYERRFTQLFGFGGMIDIVVEGHREALLGPIAFLHPFAGSKFWVAPLAERLRESGDWEFVLRIGAGWDFPLGKSGKYSIAPNINYDILEDNQLWVVGVAIGMGF